MKIKSVLFYSVLLLPVCIISAQVTEGEKVLRTQASDTTQGWKHETVFRSSPNTFLFYDDNILMPVECDKNQTVDTGKAPGKRIQYKEIIGAGFTNKS